MNPKMKEFLLKNKKQIFYGVILVGGIWAISNMLSKRKAEKAQVQYNTIPKPTEDQKKRLSQQELVSISKNLLTAMNGYGTYEQVIYDNLRKLNNEADYQALLTTFGTKKTCYGIALCTEGNLPYLLRSELSTEEIEVANSILRSRKIVGRI